jgi:hypothetical protein
MYIKKGRKTDILKKIATALEIYEQAKQGFTRKEIAISLGVDEMTMKRHIKKNKLLRKCFEKGQKIFQQVEGDSIKYQDYLFNDLPPSLKKIWNEITALEKAENGVEAVEALLLKQGKRVRQNLFLHAWINSNFNVNRALHKVNLNKMVFNLWCKEPDFLQLVEEIKWRRDNNTEFALDKAIKRGDVSAIIYGNKTRNRDRGYNTDKNINVQISGHINHQVVKVDDLNLPLDVRLNLLDALRSRRLLVESKEIKKDDNEEQQITDDNEKQVV